MPMPAPALDSSVQYRVTDIAPSLSKKGEPEMLEARHENAASRTAASRSDAIAGALLLGVTMQVFTGPIGGVLGAIAGAVAGNLIFPRVFPIRGSNGSNNGR